MIKKLFVFIFFSLIFVILKKLELNSQTDTNTYVIKTAKGNYIKIKSPIPILTKEEFEKRMSKDTINLQTLEPYIKHPNTNILISLPKFFHFNSNSESYINYLTLTNIMIKELNGINYLEATKNLTEEYIKTQNEELIEVNDVITSNGMKGKTYRTHFKINSQDTTRKDIYFERLMLFTGDEKNTIWATATYPLIFKPFIFKVLYNSLLSVKFDK